MNAGKLNKRIAIQYTGSTQDEFGAQVLTWSTLCNPWASVEPLQGREYFSAKQTISDVDTRFVVRFSTETSAVTPKMRVVYDTKNYDIESVINIDNKDKEMQLVCRKVTT